MQTNFLCALTLFISASFGMLHAQDNNVNTEFGVKGGFNMSNLYGSGDDVDDNNILYGFNAGVYATLPISDFVAIQPEILFTTKGAEFEYNNAFASGSTKFKLNYIEVPLLVRVNVTKNFNIHAGGYASYLVSSKITGDGSFDFDQEIDRDDLAKFDAGIAAGGRHAATGGNAVSGQSPSPDRRDPAWPAHRPASAGTAAATSPAAQFPARTVRRWRRYRLPRPSCR